MTDTTTRQMRRAYAGMKERCYNPKCSQFKNYGARGLTVCDRWLESFSHFVRDMGPKPEGMSLDRIDNDKGYSPENCRWASIKEQRNNQRRSQIVEMDGKVMCLWDWAKWSGMNFSTMKARIDHGMSLREAIDTPVNQAYRKSGLMGADKRWGSAAMVAAPSSAAGKERGDRG